MLEIRKLIGEDYGVFALSFIAKGSVVAICPCIMVPDKPWTDVGKSLAKFWFECTDTHNAIPLGYGCLFNHSKDPNLEHDFDGKRTMVFTAIKDIQEGEELVHNYGEDYDFSVFNEAYF